MQKCCICALPYTGYGNNPWPVEKKGRCCDICNDMHVIPARLKRFTTSTTEKQNGKEDQD